MKKILNKANLVLVLLLGLPNAQAQLFRSSKNAPKAVVKEVVNPHLNAARRYYKDDYYNLALYHLMELSKEEPQKMAQWSDLIDKVLDKTGTLPLYVYEPAFLQTIQSSTVALHLSHLAYKAKRYDEALARVSTVEKDISFYPEALLLKGSVEDVLKKGDALATLTACSKEADKYTSFIKHTKFKRYFIMIKEECLINKARILYRLGRYKDAINTYDQIEKTSYSWPYILLDKAWSYYKLKDYNRSLGLVMTYRSPLLESYFLPEAEILQSLNYFRLCLYSDSALVIDQYYKIYSEKAKVLRNMIDKHSQSDEFFFTLVSNDTKFDDNTPYLKSLRNQLRKQLKINIHLGAYQKAKEEYDRLSKDKPRASEKPFLETALANMRKMINRHSKEYVYYFLNSINYYSYEMFNIKLEIISRKKDLIYDNKRLISNRARGTFDNVNAGSSEYFFSFNGEFWADELGDASFGLKSNCKTVVIPEEEEKDQVKSKEQK